MSKRSRLLNIGLRMVAKRLLLRANEPTKERWKFAALTRHFLRAPPYSLFLEDQKLLGLWVSSKQSARQQVIFYIHGGGYIVGSPTSHRAMLARLSRQTGIRVFLPQYRLAPEHAFPAAFDDVLAAYQGLLDRGYEPQDIIIGGDSAGGGLALALLARLCEMGIAPHAAFAFSPWTDLTLNGHSLQRNAKSDVLLPVDRIEELRDMYLQGADPADVRATPLLARFSECPPVFMQVSDTEILLDDAVRMAEHLRAQGADVTLKEYSDLPHVWQMLDGWIPEARHALRQTADFIQRRFSPDP